MDPYLDGLIAHLERCFCEVGVVAPFGILAPQAAALPDNTAHTKLRIVVDVDVDVVEMFLCRFWHIKEQVVSGPLKVTLKCDIFT